VIDTIARFTKPTKFRMKGAPVKGLEKVREAILQAGGKSGVKAKEFGVE